MKGEREGSFGFMTNGIAEKKIRESVEKPVIEAKKNKFPLSFHEISEIRENSET